LKDIEALIGRRLTANGAVETAPAAAAAYKPTSQKRRRSRRRKAAGPAGANGQDRPARPQAAARRPSGPRGRAGETTNATAGQPSV
jgi:hypothetical protein